MAEDTVHDTQLRPAVRAVDVALRALPRVRFSPEAVLRGGGAVDGAGWGRDETDAAVEALCEDLAAHPPCPLGDRVVWASLTRAGRNRLRVRAYPDPAVVRPIIIVGWHRSGTTWLHRMLGSLPGCRQLPLYALMDPVPSPLRRVTAEVVVRLGQISAPEMNIIHPFRADEAEECWTLMFSSFHVEDLTTIWQVPSYTRYLDRADFRPSYALYRKSVSILGEQFPGTLILKGPGHLAHLVDLAAAYPEARFVWTHRDPGKMLASYAGLAAVQHRTVYGRFDPAAIGRLAVSRAEHALRRGMSALAAIDPARVVHVPYSELVSDPVRSVRTICDRFDLPFDAEVIATRARVPPAHHRYAAASWGLDEGEVRERVADYLDQFAV